MVINIEEKYFSDLIDRAIIEDLQMEGDVTSKYTLCDEHVCFSINSREKLVVCGIPVVKMIFDRHPEHINYSIHKMDGDIISANVTIISGIANSKLLLSLERVALNFLQHASGIASISNEFVQRVAGTSAKIRDTRKTTPGLRLLEKYAVQIGGGHSYRIGLYDGVLIKDNHIASCGTIKLAMQRIKKHLPDAFIAVECDTLKQVEDALEEKADMILLDNMEITQIQEAVNLVQGEAIVEASGQVSLEKVRAIAETGVDYISVGLITHSALNKDIGLDISFAKTV